MAGVPARRIGWMSRHGERLEFDAGGNARCPATGDTYTLRDGVVSTA
jgi:UDP-2-acetamido-3-amino-2,3-dideoxy-glucuronate N-acetyltransferase